MHNASLNCKAEITEVIDHHRLAGDLVSREPIRYLNEPVGSTCTLVGRKYFHRGLQPAPGVAMCLCAGIVSDTLCLTSPTTTTLDREMLTWLSGVAGVDPAKFTEEFFAQGSLIANGSPEEILNADRKEFVPVCSEVPCECNKDINKRGARRNEIQVPRACRSPCFLSDKRRSAAIAGSASVQYTGGGSVVAGTT